MKGQTDTKPWIGYAYFGEYLPPSPGVRWKEDERKASLDDKFRPSENKEGILEVINKFPNQNN